MRSGYVIQNGWTAGLVMKESHSWLTFERDHPGFLQSPCRQRKPN